MKNIILLFGLLSGLSFAAFADSLEANPPCSSINLKTVAIHMRCTTSKGSIYERVSYDNFGEAWRGPDGLIWSDRVGGESKQSNAMNLCENIGGELPSREDFERGEANGFREVLPNLKGHYFWTSSVIPNESFGYYFNGFNGKIYYGNRNFSLFSFLYSVRCVGQ